MTAATNDVLTKTVVETPKKKRTLSEKVEQVNKGWGILDELGENRFQIPDRKKAFDLKAVEGGIVNVSRSDAEVIKSYEEANNASVIAVQKEIQAIQDAVLPEQDVVERVVELKSPHNTQNQIKNVVIEKTLSPVDDSILNTSVNTSPSPQVAQNRARQGKKIDDNVMEDKNLFFKMVMRGLAQLYVDKTTSLFNPVVFIAKNYKFLIQTTLLLGVPAFITWYLFTQVTGLKTTFSSVSTVMYCFYAVMFYTASLFLCLTLQVVSIGFWAMIKKSISEVAVNASHKSSIEK